MLLAAFTSCSKKENASTPPAPFEEGVVIDGKVLSFDSVVVLMAGPGDVNAITYIYVDNGNPNVEMKIRLEVKQIFDKIDFSSQEMTGYIQHAASGSTGSKGKTVNMEIYVTDLLNDENSTRYEPNYGLCEKESVDVDDLTFHFDYQNGRMYLEKIIDYELCVPNSYDETIAPITITNFKVDMEVPYRH